MLKASILILSVLFLWVNPAFAQTEEAEKPVTEQPAAGSPTTDEIAAKTQAEAQFQKAKELFAAKEYDKALSALDHAWRLDENPLYLYQRIKVLQAMDEHEFALELLEKNKETLQQTEGVDDLFVVEEQLKSAIEDKQVKHPDPQPKPTSRSTLNTVGPIALGVVGLGLGGWAAYIFTASCEVEAANGDCLQGESPNTGLGIGASVGAAGAIVGAIVWWFMGAPDEPAQATVAPTSNGIMVRF